MGTSNRDRRAAKQRRRDEKRGRTAPPPAPDRGLSPEALRRILADAAADVAAGHDHALVELRHLLAEHLARRREYVLAACDEVLVATPAAGVDGDAFAEADGPEAALAAELAAELAAGGTATTWADRRGARTEEAAVATVTVLARRRRVADGS